MRFGYKRLTEASFLLVTIRNAEAARAWLASAPVADAVERDSAPVTALHIAFTPEGMHRLGLSDEVLTQFSADFLAGLSGSESRSRLLGDVGASAPERWSWGSPDRSPHVLVLLYAQPGHLHAWSEQLQDEHWHAAFDMLACLPTTNLDGIEPFGFTDGVSQPTLDWSRERCSTGDQLAYSNIVSLGEFLLGYPNEYAQYTERPLLRNSSPATSLLPSAEDQPALRDLGRNGCYLVLRTLEQDVEGFWRFVQEHAGPDRAAQNEFASAMVGRTQDGCPLVQGSAYPIPGVAPDDSQNRFTFDADEQGLACPFGAHIRRANPRNADLPSPPARGVNRLLHTLGLGEKGLRTDAKASTRFHRLLRRGREYGPELSQDQIVAQPSNSAELNNGVDPSAARGIHFIALTANITRQFEFVQNAWLMSSKFDAGTDESDPLLGNREPIPNGLGSTGPTDTFSLPGENGLRRRITGLPRFVTVRGGAYFFLPSLPALRYLASLDTVADPSEGQRQSAVHPL